MACLTLLVVLAATRSVFAAAPWENAFEVHQTMTDGSVFVKDFEPMEINGQTYLAVANYWDPATRRYNIDSIVYRWIDEKDMFVVAQRIGTYGATAVKTFVIDGEQYLAVANHVVPQAHHIELREECYSRGDLLGGYPGVGLKLDNAGPQSNGPHSSLEDCADACSETLHCSFWRYNVDKAFCEVFTVTKHQGEIQANIMRGTHNVISAVFSGTNLGNCSMSGHAQSESGSTSRPLSTSKIYKMERTNVWHAGELDSRPLFVEQQRIQTEGVVDIEPFIIHKSEKVKNRGTYTQKTSYLAIAEERNVAVYRWNQNGFHSHQILANANARDVEALQIDGKTYLVVAIDDTDKADDHGDQEQKAGKSIVYRWEDADSDHWPDSVQHVDGAFVKHQEISVVGAYQVESFESSGMTFIAVANQRSSFDGIGHNIFKWDGTAFRAHMLLNVRGAIHFEAFMMDGQQFLAVASPDPSETKVYRVDPTPSNQHEGFVHGNLLHFTEIQAFLGHPYFGGQSIKAFSFKGNQYLAVATKQTTATHLQDVESAMIYRAPVPCSIANSNQQPGAQCMCDDGYDGNVQWLSSIATGGDSKAIGDCVPAECKIANSNHVDGPDCECSTGYEGSIEWTGPEADGSCEFQQTRFLLIGVPALMITMAVLGGIFYLVYRKRGATASQLAYGNFQDDCAAQTPSKSTAESHSVRSIIVQPVPATVVGSPDKAHATTKPDGMSTNDVEANLEEPVFPATHVLSYSPSGKNAAGKCPLA